jgi:hypothetical protein
MTRFPFAAIEAKRIAAEETEAKKAKAKKAEESVAYKTLDRLNTIQNQADYQYTMQAIEEIRNEPITHQEKMAKIATVMQGKNVLTTTSNKVQAVADNLLNSKNTYVSDMSRKALEKWNKVKGSAAMYNYKNPEQGIQEMIEYQKMLEGVADLQEFANQLKTASGEKKTESYESYPYENQKLGAVVSQTVEGSGWYMKKGPNGYETDIPALEKQTKIMYENLYPGIDPIDGTIEIYNKEAGKFERHVKAPTWEDAWNTALSEFKVSNKSAYQTTAQYSGGEAEALDKAPTAYLSDPGEFEVYDISVGGKQWMFKNTTSGLATAPEEAVRVPNNIIRDISDFETGIKLTVPENAKMVVESVIALTKESAAKIARERGLAPRDYVIVTGSMWVIKKDSKGKDMYGQMIDPNNAAKTIDDITKPVIVRQRITFPYKPVERQIAGKQYKVVDDNGNKMWIENNDEFIKATGGKGSTDVSRTKEAKEVPVTPKTATKNNQQIGTGSPVHIEMPEGTKIWIESSKLGEYKKAGAKVIK